MQAIITKYLGPTDRRGSRVKAIADAGSITVAWDSALSAEQNHDAAALALTRKFRWDAKGYRHSLVRGGMPMATPYAYCYVPIGGRADEYDRVPMKQSDLGRPCPNGSTCRPCDRHHDDDPCCAVHCDSCRDGEC